MVRYFTILSIVIAHQMAFAQFNNIYTEVDEMPYFSGCDNFDSGSIAKRLCSNEALVQYMTRNLNFKDNPDIPEGKIYISFVVDQMGKIQYPKLLNELLNSYSDSILQVVKDMPRWTPGVKNGRPVKVKMNLPLVLSPAKAINLQHNYRITWGQIRGSSANKDLFKSAEASPVTIRDQYGNEKTIDQLTITYEHGKQYKEAVSKGAINEAMKKILKKVKAGGTLTVHASVQNNGAFRDVIKEIKVVN